ncbi:cation/H(+) antiporter 15-like [Vigna unguiculata]|uniref:cation/H(+) antiporter 15-like n=1 Tax=Vigna unguiculata TaxID=3917 RepID=UPI0010169C0E|nr:cation/H(+) antiporter 15-like [Vigna unguiculata]
MAEVGKRFLEYQLIVDNPNPAGLLVCPQLVAGTIAFTFVAPPKALLGIETMAHLGLIYNVFLTGLEMNLDAILLASRKATTIAMASTIIPMLLGAALYSMAQSLYKGPNLDMSLYNTTSAYLFWALVLSVTNFPVLANILADLKILYTELGRVAVTAATISDFYNWAMFVLLIPFACRTERPFLSVILTIFFVLFCYLVLRPFLTKLLNKKTENNEWDNYKLSYVLVGVLACAHVTEMLGTHSIVGALVYGLMLPRGKFADMLMERSDDLVSMYLEPLFFVGCGIRFDFSSFKLHKVVNVIIIIVMSCCTKIVSTVITAWFYSMPFRDGVALGALLNTKGILPLVMLNIAIDRQILSRDFYTVMVVASVVMTILVTPTINFIYKPRKQFKKNKLRTVQNLKADAEIRIMVCVHNPRHATGMMSILEACSCSNATHLRVFALQLIEMKGRGTAFLIDQGGGSPQSQADTESIRDIFSEFKPERGLINASVETLAAVSSYETIHKDIHHIADERQTSLILLPFHKHSSAEGALEETNPVFREINRNVMRYAPCSVGILVDRGKRLLSEMNLPVAICIVFIGGPDDREALAIAWRMARHKGIHLSMVHILLFGKVAEVDTSATMNDEGNGILSPMLDCAREKELDEEYMSLFRLMAVNNEHSVTYSEKEVHTADDIPLVLDELEREGYDLYVLGHGKRRNSTVLSKLLEWTDCPELGVMGDMLASNSFGSCSSVLVVQQYGFGGMHLRAINQTTCESNEDDIEAIFKVKSIKYIW